VTAYILPVLATATETWHHALLHWTGRFAILVVVGGMFICIFRLLRGPHLADRALAVDVVAIQLIGLVILLTMHLGSLVLFDGILVLSLLGFAGTVAMANYIGRPHLRKRMKQQETPEADS